MYIKQQFLASHTILETEIWVTNTPSVKMFCPQKKIACPRFFFSIGLLRISQVFFLSPLKLFISGLRQLSVSWAACRNVSRFPVFVLQLCSRPMLKMLYLWCMPLLLCSHYDWSCVWIYFTVFFYVLSLYPGSQILPQSLSGFECTLLHLVDWIPLAFSWS
jgi:hypothetical protein